MQMIRVLVIVLAGLGCAAAVVKPIVGILPFHVSEELGKEIGHDKLYVSGSLSKWFETYHTRWVPLDMNSPDLDQHIEKLNGLVLMGEFEESNRGDLIQKYEAQVLNLLYYVERMNTKRYFPLIAIGYGAHIVFKKLAKSAYQLFYIKAKNQQIPFEFTDADSAFKKFVDTPQRFNAKYPNLCEWFINAKDMEEGQPLAKDFTLVAKGKVDHAGKTEEVVGFFEYNRLPVFGLMSDYQTVHFSHGLIDDDAFSEQALDIGFELAGFWAHLLKKGEISTGQEFVSDMRKGWKRYASKQYAAQFEEIFVRDL